MTTRDDTLVLRPIGVVHSPFQERSQAPRQPRARAGVEGTIELYPASGIEHALEDLENFRYLWVLFWFHMNSGFRAKVLPPRSRRRRGVFATRSPYRPNPIGMSAVELVEVRGLVLSVRDLDMLDGTPVLDLKPYIAYADALPDAGAGWLEPGAADPKPGYAVEFSPRALEQLVFLGPSGVELRERVEQLLELGAEPHAYRRIKRQGAEGVLAFKAWRFDFVIEGERIVVSGVRSGYRPSEIFAGSAPGLDVHREFVARFGVSSA